MWDPTQDAWAAGFIDGEGSFVLARKRQPRRGELEIIGVQPIFSIGLRADDVDALDSLAAAFGGSVRYNASVGARGGSRPRYQWTMAAKNDLVRLIAYLDRFPLRAKKARDYTIWRRAVRVYLADGARAPELVALRSALNEGRVYREPAERVRDVAPTRREVAELAGVASSTVGRVLAGHPSVTGATRAAVEAAIRQLGYMPRARTGDARPTLRRVV